MYVMMLKMTSNNMVHAGKYCGWLTVAGSWLTNKWFVNTEQCLIIDHGQLRVMNKNGC